MALNKMVLPPSSTGPSTVIGLVSSKPATIYVYTSGAASYDVQASLDDPMTTPAAQMRWITAPDIPPGQTGSYTGKLVTPANALRLNVSSNAAALEIRVLQ